MDPGRRLGILQVGPDELLEQSARGYRIPGPLEPDPVRFRLVATRDRVLQRREGELENRDREQCERNRAGIPQAAATTRRVRGAREDGNSEQGTPAQALPDVTSG